MTTDTSTLTGFLLEQIAADEAGTARAYRDLAETLGNQGMPLVAEWLTEQRARVLATCAAHRAIMEEHGLLVDVEEFDSCQTCRGEDATGCLNEWTNQPYPCSTLRALAAIYKDAPGFDARWVDA